MFASSPGIAAFLAMGVLMAASGPPSGPSDPSKLLPGEMNGWAPVGADGIYDSQSLYDLIDGGAEVYRALNVRRVVSRRYEKEGAPTVIVDLFDMGSSRDAFGAYRHDMREGEDVGIGQESELLGSSLSFWKDRFFISIVPFDDREDLRQTVLELGRSIAAAIPREGEKPGLVKLLPPGGLMEDQIHYFHDWPLLGTHLFISEDNLLNLNRRTEGILARYRHERHSKGGESTPTAYSLLLILYPDPESAEQAGEDFHEAYLPGADGEGMMIDERGTWTGIRRLEDLLVIILDSPSRVEALDQMREIERIRGHEL
jgi:hypothetical protein